MATSFQFELVSPEKLLVSRMIGEVSLPGGEGYLTVLPDHAPMVTRLAAGIVRLKDDTNNEQAFVILGGFADISGTSCSLLAEQAIPLGGFDPQMLENYITQAQEELQAASNDGHRNRIEDFLHELVNMRDALA